MTTIYTSSSQVQSLLGNLTLGQLEALSQSNPALARALVDDFARASGSPLSQFLGSGIPPAGYMPSPHTMLPSNQQICGCGYGGRETIDLARGVPNTFYQRTFGDRREAAKTERLLRTDDTARSEFEAAIGGRIVSFGDADDGSFTIERYPRGYAPIPGQAFNPQANNVLGLLGGMDAAVAQQAAGMSMGTVGGAALLGAGAGALGGAMMYGNPFMGLVTGGLGGVLAGMGAGMGGIGQFGMGGAPMGMGGLGFGSWNPLAMPGGINNTNPLYERAHQMQVASVLYDPSLTVEDKVTLLIMLIMKKMDKDIERQAQYINAIQQQQSNRNQMGGMFQMLGGVAGTIFGGPMVGGQLGAMAGGMMGGMPMGQSSPSIDVETMKLKRMIDKRSQMFDMLRQIIDKYNETAKNIIQSIGR